MKSSIKTRKLENNTPIGIEFFERIIMFSVGDNEEFQEEIFNFESSSEKMSFNIALGFWFLKDMRLVELNGENSVAVR